MHRTKDGLRLQINRKGTGTNHYYKVKPTGRISSGENINTRMTDRSQDSERPLGVSVDDIPLLA